VAEKITVDLSESNSSIRDESFYTVARVLTTKLATTKTKYTKITS